MRCGRLFTQLSCNASTRNHFEFCFKEQQGRFTCFPQRLHKLDVPGRHASPYVLIFFLVDFFFYHSGLQHICNNKKKVVASREHEGGSHFKRPSRHPRTFAVLLFRGRPERLSCQTKVLRLMGKDWHERQRRAHWGGGFAPSE